tara:strand:- start:1293 stop:1475 length:183 start_codon:yes stop_codon:yes gene_type:complete
MTAKDQWFQAIWTLEEIEKELREARFHGEKGREDDMLREKRETLSLITELEKETKVEGEK